MSHITTLLAGQGCRERRLPKLKRAEPQSSLVAPISKQTGVGRGLSGQLPLFHPGGPFQPRTAMFASQLSFSVRFVLCAALAVFTLTNKRKQIQL
jgi:hypothetical protein